MVSAESAHADADKVRMPRFDAALLAPVFIAALVACARPTAEVGTVGPKAVAAEQLLRGGAVGVELRPAEDPARPAATGHRAAP